MLVSEHLSKQFPFLDFISYIGGESSLPVCLLGGLDVSVGNILRPVGLFIRLYFGTRPVIMLQSQEVGASG